MSILSEGGWAGTVERCGVHPWEGRVTGLWEGKSVWDTRGTVEAIYT